MNNPNPFVPQGSLLDQKNKKRVRFKVAIISIFAVNIVFVSGLLIQGCGSKKEAGSDTTTTALNTDTNPTPPQDTNLSNATQLPPPPTNGTPVVSNTPPPPPPPPPPPVPETQEYVVQKGDSYYSIAKKFHVKTKELESANPNTPANKLKVGQKLQVPASTSSAGAGSSGGMSAVDTGDSLYTVKAGDSLAKIAKTHNSTIRLIREANDLKGDRIKVGQKLKVPPKSAPADTGAGAPVPMQPTPPPPAPSEPAPTSSAPAPGTGH